MFLQVFFDFHVFQVVLGFCLNTVKIFYHFLKNLYFCAFLEWRQKTFVFYSIQRAHRHVFNLLLLNERSIPHAKTEVLVATHATSNPTAEEPPTILQRRYTAELNLQRRHRPQQDSKTYSGRTASTGRICHRKMSESIYIIYIYIYINIGKYLCSTGSTPFFEN